MKCPTQPRCSLSNEDHQPFPTKAGWPQHLNRTRKYLDRLQKKFHTEPVYSYVISSIDKEEVGDVFRQKGSGPNFQGGRITLCTCKHRMRTYPKITDPNSAVWIAGFTGVKVHGRKNWLFYLMRVENEKNAGIFDSHSDLWRFDSPGWKEIRKEKSSRQHAQGDVFEPKKRIPSGDSKGKFHPKNYYHPCLGHAHRKHEKTGKPRWHKDICYEGQNGRKAVLLLGEKKNSFLWSGPRICFTAGRHPRGEKRWDNLKDFLKALN